MTALEGYGIKVDLPANWEGRLYQRPQPTAVLRPDRGPTAEGRIGWAGEQTLPALHVANFPLPPERGDYGTGATERMGPTHSFLALLKFGPAEVNSALYPPVDNVPRPTAREFSPNAMQQALPGLMGYQRFFTYRGQAWCLFAVAGSAANLGEVERQLNDIINRIEVQ